MGNFLFVLRFNVPVNNFVGTEKISVAKKMIFWLFLFNTLKIYVLDKYDTNMYNPVNNRFTIRNWVMS